MSLDDQIRSFLPHVVTVKPFERRDVHNEPSFGESRAVKGYVTPGEQITRGLDRETITTNATVVLDDDDVSVDDRIVMPAEFGGDEVLVTSVAHHDYVDGLKHTVVTVE